MSFVDHNTEVGSRFARVFIWYPPDSNSWGLRVRCPGLTGGFMASDSGVKKHYSRRDLPLIRVRTWNLKHQKRILYLLGHCEKLHAGKNFGSWLVSIPESMSECPCHIHRWPTWFPQTRSGCMPRSSSSACRKGCSLRSQRSLLRQKMTQ